MSGRKESEVGIKKVASEKRERGWNWHVIRRRSQWEEEEGWIKQSWRREIESGSVSSVEEKWGKELVCKLKHFQLLCEVEEDEEEERTSEEKMSWWWT